MNAEDILAQAKTGYDDELAQHPAIVPTENEALGADLARVTAAAAAAATAAAAAAAVAAAGGGVEAKKIVIIDAGGTIGGVRGPNGIVAVEGSIRWWLESNHVLVQKTFQHGFECVSHRAIDSSNADPRWILDLMKLIYSSLSKSNVVGLVVTHGTDTLAYSAAIATLLFDTSKPVAFTAAQYNLHNYPFSDASNNLLGAMQAASYNLRTKRGDALLTGVVVYMNYELFHGARVCKTNATDVASFSTLTMARIGVWRGGEIIVDHSREKEMMFGVAKRILKKYVRGGSRHGVSQNLLANALSSITEENYLERECNFLRHVLHALPVKFIVRNSFALDGPITDAMLPAIRLLYVYPGMSNVEYAAIVNGASAIIVAGFGCGNVPDNIKQLIVGDNTKMFGICSQCGTGFVSSAYNAGFPTDIAHIALCADMTIEAAFAKAFVLILTQRIGIRDSWKVQMEQSWRGELTHEKKTS